MQLSLQGLSHRVGAAEHLYPMDLTLQAGAVTVLLGATQAGKTTLMRLIAGLDRPSAGRVLVDGQDVTGVPVRDRNVAMVYQQFINYPSMTVRDNIASPLKLRGGLDRAAIAKQVDALAQKLHIEMHLDKLPAQLSGGQQQRVALARALAKNAPLMLLDEPLVNLDYKLREELREELSQLFASGDSTVVYATTEPGEALLLGGYTAVMDAGELLQYGPTAEVFHKPASLRVARAFSDPPMNLLPATGRGASVELRPGLSLDLSAQGPVTVGLRANALRVSAQPGDIELRGRVELAEISGSDTFVHVHSEVGELVAQLSGVHYFELGASLSLFFRAAEAYVFDAAGALAIAPERRGR
ncbi:ABC transporter ATP-binding protein [Kinneretia asaccharophila]|uniref:Carbohydrate ABC transporter ATP-binding protein (CUT1 family) n=1 Tax=Roseateles asaccharophilus TaxID=582607 RepID=A0A4R6NAN4_9BURK|nr:ABC transporter ATP-binding protein [Roseateles asaccharophilus]MDN3544923.1 ABC transporter ATP-binding protein [Roseateles asaccharophilus]TDP12691.1 carbohydrate ABC transporter ATP-binding protein (CUT1 family) [Roseateles asaccharophilus]